MKTKLTLIAIALLAIAPLANAGFTMTPTGSGAAGVYTISIDAADITLNGYLVIAVQGTGVLSNFALSADAPVNSSLNGNTVDSEVAFLGQGEVYGVADFALAPAVPVYKNGTWLTATLTGVAGDVVKSYSSADLVEFTEIGSFTVNAIPEPITVALMGLGGLFVARKNKK
jgi:hypothetical protein